MIYIPRPTFTVWGTPCHYDPQTELEYLVMKYPHKPWSYENLARNPNIVNLMVIFQNGMYVM